MLQHTVTDYNGEDGSKIKPEAEEMKKQVLVADDNPELRRIYATVFEMMNYQVMVASDGDETLDLLETLSPDLLVLDVNMPNQTGLDVLREVRQRPALLGTRVMLLTGNINVFNQPDAAEADLIMVKPVNVPDLISSVRKLLK